MHGRQNLYFKLHVYCRINFYQTPQVVSPWCRWKKRISFFFINSRSNLLLVLQCAHFSVLNSCFVSHLCFYNSVNTEYRLGLIRWLVWVVFRPTCADCLIVVAKWISCYDNAYNTSMSWLTGRSTMAQLQISPNDSPCPFTADIKQQPSNALTRGKTCSLTSWKCQGEPGTYVSGYLRTSRRT